MSEGKEKPPTAKGMKTGGRFVPVRQGDMTSIKRLRAQCQEAGIPATVGPCPGGG